MTLIRRLFLIFMLSSVVQAAQVIRYVDPDAAGAGNGTSWADAYTSLNAWNTGEATNLVTAGDYHTVYCQSSGGTDDTTACTISGWTTDVTHYVEVIGYDFPADGIKDTSKYYLNVTDATVLTISSSNVYIRKLQINLTQTAGNLNTCILMGTAFTDIWIDSCYVTFSGAGNGAYGIRPNGNFINCIIYNTIVQGFVNGADADFQGIYFAGGYANHFAYNCTVYGCYSGLVSSNSTNQIVNVINCAVGNNTDDFGAAGFDLIDYCCSDDGDGTNAQNPSGGSWANEFTTPGTDFSLVGGNCVGNGTDDPGSGLYSDDIIDTARSSTWDIGAFEYGGAPPAGGGGQVIKIGMD